MPLDNAFASAGWMSRGACQHEDPELFFPISAAARLISAAKAVCQACAVRAPCLSYALQTRQDGIWGGTTQEERHAMHHQASGAA
jgi:WhiB family transcriptional regulator, redox-sensing transcriptional regulator